ncbi:ExeM/NucH family extracellular endonuclease [Corynebacterium phoceense]
MHSRRIGTLAIAALVSSLATIPAHAATDGSQVVISEAYGGGGNSGAAYTHDFIELYNPTDADIDLTGYTVEYFSGKGGSGGKATLTGTIPAGGHFLIQGGQGNGGTTALPTPDADAGLTMSGTNGAVQLADAAGTTVDTVGYGSATINEGSPVAGASSSQSVFRDAAGTDTDNNAADFTAGAPTPQNSGATPTGPIDPEAPVDPTDPVTPVDPATITPIAEIQGTGAASPLVDQTVTTEGVVTAVWKEGGLNGFTIQTGGTGETAPKIGEASQGIFVYMGSRTDYPELGASVQVSGRVSEFYNATQITAAEISSLAVALPAVTPLAIDELPAGDAAREPFEGMLVQPGTHTVTNNYALNTYGEVGLNGGTEYLRQPSDIYEPSKDPNSDLQKLAASNKERLVILDDARTKNYMQSDKNTPLPYVSQDGGSTIKSLRTTDHVEFQHPVVVHYSHDAWRFEPTTPVTGNTSGADLPISWKDSRAAIEGGVDVKGDYTIGAFNVLNYFVSLGEEFDGTSYKDKDGNPVTVNRGTTRGAWTASALADQQAKIVAAINGLDADVIALSEIENGYAVTGDINERDNALKTLTEALNAAGGNWEYVKSPSNVPVKGDVIRTAFIYAPDRVKPVGESRIFTDDRFTGTAREPLAQEFAATDPNVKETFVAVANHFKSKGSVAKGDADSGDGQGNNPNVRNAQAQAVLDHLAKQKDWEGKATFVMGDLNTYTMEKALGVFRTNGYTVPAETYGADPSYQFDGLLGTLDHVLANEVASGKVSDAQVWNINSDESVAFEYSRRNYNVVDFYDNSPFRASDHDPVKVGFSLSATAPSDDDQPKDEDPKDDDTTSDARGVKEMKIVDGELIVYYTDGTEQNLGTVRGEPGKDGEDGTNGVDGKDGADGKDGRGIDRIEANEDGSLTVTFTDGTQQNVKVAGQVTKEAGDEETDKDTTPGKDADGADSSSLGTGGIVGIVLAVLALVGAFPFVAAVFGQIPDSALQALPAPVRAALKNLKM